jgi:hypothetical protein
MRSSVKPSTRASACGRAVMSNRGSFGCASEREEARPAARTMRMHIHKGRSNSETPPYVSIGRGRFRREATPLRTARGHNAGGNLQAPDWIAADRGGTVNRHVQPLFNHYQPSRRHRPLPRAEPQPEIWASDLRTVKGKPVTGWGVKASWSSRRKSELPESCCLI